MVEWAALLVDALADAVAARVSARLEQRAPAPRLLTVEQAAHYLGRTPQAIRQMISSGKLCPVKGDRHVQLDIRDLDIWIERSKIEP